MKKPIEIQIPLFKGTSRNPAKLIGETSSFVDAEKVTGLVSGAEDGLSVVDIRNNETLQQGGKGPAPVIATGYTWLLLAGGHRVLAVGAPKVFAALFVDALNGKPALRESIEA